MNELSILVVVVWWWWCHMKTDNWKKRKKPCATCRLIKWFSAQLRSSYKIKFVNSSVNNVTFCSFCCYVLMNHILKNGQLHSRWFVLLLKSRKLYIIYLSYNLFLYLRYSLESNRLAISPLPQPYIKKCRILAVDC